MGKKDEAIEASVVEEDDEGGGKKAKEAKKPKKFKAPPGPLAPFRLLLVVGVSAITTGLPLWHAWTSGVDVDLALGRSFAVGFVLWIVVGRISRMLGMAQLEAEVERRRAAIHAVASAPAGHHAAHQAGHHTPAVDDADVHHAA